MKRRDLLQILPATAGGLVLAGAAGASAGPGIPLRADLSWWREARFGMFVHWGPVSLRGTEIGWSRGKEVPVAEYDALLPGFNPTKFDANAWARPRRTWDGLPRLHQQTSRRLLPLAERLTDYDIVNTPFGRDVLRELASACRKHDIRFCTYHSICDWRHPDYPLGSPGARTASPRPTWTATPPT